MEMQMRVPIPVSGRKAKSSKDFELSSDFVAEFRMQRRTECIPQSGASRRPRKPPCRIREPRNLGSQPIAQGKVQSDTKTRVPLGNGDRLSHRWSGYHEACLIQHTASVESLDRFIHHRVGSEVVAGNKDA
jgi:hypothetical protein